MVRILLIDPPGDLEQALRSSPLLEGALVDTATSDGEALRRLRVRSYDVLFTNPGTAVEDDLVFLAEARLARPGVRPIVLTNGAAPQEVIKALRSQVFAFFSKPWDLPEVTDMTRRAAAATDWHEGIEVVSARPDRISLRVNCALLTVERLVRSLSELGKDLPEDDRDEVMLAFRELIGSSIRVPDPRAA
jgi:DNA-binding NtrC family response regulator